MITRLFGSIGRIANRSEFNSYLNMLQRTRTAGVPTHGQAVKDYSADLRARYPFI